MNRSVNLLAIAACLTACSVDRVLPSGIQATGDAALSIGAPTANGNGVRYAINYGETQTEQTSTVPYVIPEGTRSTRYGSFWLRGSYVGQYGYTTIYFSQKVRNVNLTASGMGIAQIPGTLGSWFAKGSDIANGIWIAEARPSRWDFQHGILLLSDVSSIKVGLQSGIDLSNLSFTTESSGLACGVEFPEAIQPQNEYRGEIVHTDCGVDVTFEHGLLRDRTPAQIANGSINGSMLRTGIVPSVNGRVIVEFPTQGVRSFASTTMSRGSGYIVGYNSAGDIVASAEFNQDGNSVFTVQPVRILAQPGERIVRVEIGGSPLVAVNNLLWTP
jgi:hypothetical protein